MAEAVREPWRNAARLMLLCLALAQLAAARADERIIEQLDIEQPRSFGYHIGDRFSRVVQLALRQPYTLHGEALPTAGRFSEWLALETPRVTSERHADITRYEIRFDYQVVNVGSEAASIAVPHHELVYSNGRETLKALIPATRVKIAPLRDSADTRLQEDQAPARLHFDATVLWSCAATLTLCVLALAILEGGLPAWRRARPFAVARRAVRAARRRGWREEDYDLALRAVHRAFNETAGRTVFADTLRDFFTEHAPFMALSTPVTEFYVRSRSYFYAADGDAPAPRYTARELATLVRRCHAIERGRR